MNEPIAELRVENLVRRVGGFELRAGFTVAPGERVGLLGRSGIGKTLLLRSIAGLDPVDGGGILLGSEDITHVPAQERRFGVVFQEPALFPHLDLLDNVTFALRLRGIRRNERERIAQPWLEKVGLAAAAAGSGVETLSGGERQRIAFLRALIWKPRVLLLDEPFTALDERMRHTLRNELLQLHPLWPAPMILVTHDSADLSALATSRLGFSEEGNLRIVRREET